MFFGPGYHPLAVVNANCTVPEVSEMVDIIPGAAAQIQDALWEGSQTGREEPYELVVQWKYLLVDVDNIIIHTIIVNVEEIKKRNKIDLVPLVLAV